MNLMEKIVSLSKRRGFVFPGSEIYGGLANTYDYGPLGVELKRNIKDLWWKQFVTRREDIYGIDGGILLGSNVWEASGHVENFTDPLAECLKCHKRFRIDLIDNAKKCPECGGELSDPKNFNGMFKTNIGAVEDGESTVYLRPETAQAIFINFKNVVSSFHPKLPFGIAQIGKAFRNEITAGNFINRMLEFEQMEIEYFIKPESDWEKVFNKWLDDMQDFAYMLGVDKKDLSLREHDEDERSHYSKKTVDVEYDFPFGKSELWGLAYRTDYDLKCHSKNSGEDLSYFDDEEAKRYFPHVVEPSMGVDRTILMTLLSNYHEEKERVYLSFPPSIAPVKVAVFPLLSNKKELVDLADRVFKSLIKNTNYNIVKDTRGNIGKRYLSQDEIGTPWCVTIDFESIKGGDVTIRDRDTTKQIRLPIDNLASYFQNEIEK